MKQNDQTASSHCGVQGMYSPRGWTIHVMEPVKIFDDRTEKYLRFKEDHH